MVPRKGTGSKKPKKSAAKRRAKKEPVLRCTVQIINQLGLHARPSALFVQTANKFPKCTIRVSNGSATVDGRSIMGIMTLAAARGTELTLEISGPDARKAMTALCELIAGKFDEE